MTEKLSEGLIGSIRNRIADSNAGGQPLSEDEMSYVKDALDSGAAIHEDFFPVTNRLKGTEMLGEMGKTAVGGAIDAVGGAVSLGGHLLDPQNPFSDKPRETLPFNFLERGGKAISEVGESIKTDKRGIPLGQRMALAGADLAGATAVPGVVFNRAGKIVSKGLTHLQLSKLGIFKKLLADAYKEPVKFLAVEEAIASIAGASGEAASDVGGEAGRIVTELVTSFGIVAAGRILSSVGNIVKMKIPSEKQAEDVIGEFLAAEFDEAPTIERALQETDALIEEAPGLSPTLSQATRSKTFAKAEDELGVPLSEEAMAMNARTADAIKDFAFKIVPRQVDESAGVDAFAEFAETASKGLDEHIGNMQSRLDDLIKRVEVEVIPGEGSAIARTQSGDAVRDEAASLENLARRSVSAVYQGLGDVPVHPRNIRPLYEAVLRAGRTVLKETPVPDSVQSYISRIKAAFPPGTVSRDKATGKFKRSDLSQSRFQGLVEIEQGINEDLRALRKAGKGKSDEARRLMIVKNGISGNGGVFDNLAMDPTLAKNNNGVMQVMGLRKAKEGRIAFGKLFETFELKKIFKQSGTGLHNVAAEDVMDVFITKGRGAFRAADAFKRVLGHNPEAVEIVKSDFHRRLRAMAYNKTTGKLEPRKIIQFREQYKDAIEAYDEIIPGLKDSFFKREEIFRNQDAIISGMGADLKTESRLALKIQADVSNPEKFVDGLIQNPREMEAFVRTLPDVGLAKDGLIDLAVDRIITRTISRQPLGVSAGNPTIYDIKFLNKVLDDPNGVFKRVIGEDHYRDLTTFAKLVGRATPEKPHGHTPGPAKTIDQPTTAQFLSSIRNVLKGFVRSDFIFMQLSERMATATRNRLQREVLTNALKNPQYAKKLLETARAGPLSGAVKSILSPVGGIALSRVNEGGTLEIIGSGAERFSLGDYIDTTRNAVGIK